MRGRDLMMMTMIVTSRAVPPYYSHTSWSLFPSKDTGFDSIDPHSPVG